MKKKIALCMCLFMSSTFSIFAESEWEKPHEISISYGYETSTALFQSDYWDWGCCDEPDLIDRDYSYSGGFSISYMYRMGEKVKFGASLTYEQTRFENTLRSTEVPKEYYEMLENAGDDPLKQREIKRLIEDYQSRLDEAKPHVGTSRKNHLTILPQVKLTYINREHFAFYQRYGAGFDFQMREDVAGNKNNSVGLNLCIVPVGFEFGGNSFRAFFECPALSPQGFLNIGVKYDF